MDVYVMYLLMLAENACMPNNTKEKVVILEQHLDLCPVHSCSFLRHIGYQQSEVLDCLAVTHCRTFLDAWK